MTRPPKPSPHSVITGSFFAPWLRPEQEARWRSFAEGIPWVHYEQDPRWAEVERDEAGRSCRRPFFFWSECNGQIVLTAVGVRRSLPVPGRAFWEFKKGPVCSDPEVLDAWLPWLDCTIGRETARLQVEPPIPLNSGGDDAETVLERHGFSRRRSMGTWATLLVDLSASEHDLLGSVRSDIRRSIRKSLALGISIEDGDTPAGRSALWGLLSEMRARTSIRVPEREALDRISRCWLRGGTGGFLLIGRHEGVAVAAILVIVFRGVASMSMLATSRRHRGPTSHLLLWEAIRRAKSAGCHSFDLGGLSLVARPGDQLWGVNQFKRGFAPRAQPTKAVALHEKVYSPLLVAAARAIRRRQAHRPEPQ